MEESRGAPERKVPWRWRRKKPLRRRAKAAHERKPRKGLPSINPERAQERAEYRRLREIYRSEHPFCECGCGGRTEQIHHKAGCEGKLLLDTRHWMAVTFQCHERINNHPGWAREQGYLYEVDHLTGKIRRR